jgi:hypothetical protein
MGHTVAALDATAARIARSAEVSRQNGIRTARWSASLSDLRRCHRPLAALTAHSTHTAAWTIIFRMTQRNEISLWRNKCMQVRRGV